MLKGIDLSHHNIENKAKKIDTAKKAAIAEEIKKADFVIVKQTEGKTYVDARAALYLQMCGKDKLIGQYHYARPENNDAAEEALHFCEYFEPYKNRSVPILDWEQVSLNYPVTWALKWLDFVQNKTGVKPLFYCQGSYTPKIGIIRNAGYGLYVANYKALKPKIGVYPYYAIWQYTSSPIDRDYFNGSREAWLKYAAVKR